MANIIIRHVNGTKANQVEEVPIQGFRELLVGREANAHIRFDAEREDLVSRNHARIVRDPADSNGFLLMDLDSRNGTFVNRQRIYGAARLQHGDRVQMGPSGPEFAFELDPPPSARATRLAETGAPPPTREASIATGMSGRTVSGLNAPPGPDGPRPVGRVTVERMLGDVTSQMKGESRRTMWAALIGVLVLILAGAGYMVWSRQQQAITRARDEAERATLNAQLSALMAKEDSLKGQIASASKGGRSEDAKKLQDELGKTEAANRELQVKFDALTKPPESNPLGGKGGDTGKGAGGVDLTPEQIHAKWAKSVVLIETTFKITDTNGQQLYIYRIPNTDGVCESVPSGDYLPLFVENSTNGELEPVLSTLSNDGHNAPVVATVSGTGFVVSGEGFFLTNRHVLAPWRSTWNAYEFTKKTTSEKAAPPFGIKVKNSRVVGCISANEFPRDWVPVEGSELVIDQKDADAIRLSKRLAATPVRTKVLGEGVYNVTFAKTMQRYRASSITLSEKHDVALGKVDTPSARERVEVFTDQEAVQPGQTVVVMGYPAISPMVVGVDVSRDMFTTRPHYDTIADPTLSSGPISKVISSAGSIRGVDGVISEGEMYQLGIATTGAGNSGGPVFDSKGRVIAIFYAGGTVGGATATFAVPIKYGQELISDPSAVK